MIDLQGRKGELRATIEITRAATGKKEIYELVGHASESIETESEELKNVSDTLNCSA